MKKVLFTENQLKTILGEDFGVFLDDLGNDIPGNSFGTEVSTIDGLDGDRDCGLTSDEFGRIATSKNPLAYGFGKTKAEYTCESKKKRLNEANKDIVNKTMTFPQNLQVELQQALNNADKSSTGYKRLANLIQSGKITTNEAYRILNDYQEQGYSNQSVIPYDVIMWIKHQLNTMTGISKSQKETKKQLGYENAFQQQGYTKTSGNGMAHTPKNNGNVTFTYQN